MKISCPICETSIEVSKFLVGQKGRCPRCSSKFIIPESPEDEMEILERGEIPADEAVPVPPPPPPPPIAEPEPQPVAETPAAAAAASSASAARPVMPATGAPVRKAARPVVVKQSSGAFGFLFAIVLAALVGAIVYVMMDKQRKDDGAIVETPPEEAKPEEVAPKPAPQAPAPVVAVEETAGEGIAVYPKFSSRFLKRSASAATVQRRPRAAWRCTPMRC